MAIYFLDGSHTYTHMSIYMCNVCIHTHLLPLPKCTYMCVYVCVYTHWIISHKNKILPFVTWMVLEDILSETSQIDKHHII